MVVLYVLTTLIIAIQIRQKIRMANLVTEDDLKAAFESYRDDVKARIAAMGQQITDLKAAVAAGDQSKAQSLLDEITAAHNELTSAASGEAPQQPAQPSTSTTTEETAGGN